MIAKTTFTMTTKAFASEKKQKYYIQVTENCTVLVYDNVAGHYTTCHALSKGSQRAARIRAKKIRLREMENICNDINCKFKMEVPGLTVNHVKNDMVIIADDQFTCQPVPFSVAMNALRSASQAETWEAARTAMPDE